MKINTLKEYRKYQMIRQNFIFYIILLIIFFDSSILISLSHLEEGTSGESWDNSEYYISEEQAENIPKIVLPVSISLQLVLIFWFSRKYYRLDNKKDFNYYIGLIWLLWTILGFGFYYTSYCFSYKNKLYLLGYFPYLIGQFFLIKFWKHFLIAHFHVLCPKCKKENLIESCWCTYTKGEYAVKKDVCIQCKEDLNLSIDTKVYTNKEYIFNWSEHSYYNQYK